MAETPVTENPAPAPARPTSARKPLVEGGVLSAGVLLIAALVGIVNYFGYKYHARWDWTSDQLYSLSEKSLNVVRGLDKDVEAVVFMRPGEQMYDQVNELLSRYEAASPRIKVRKVDPDRNLAEAQSLVTKYQVSDLNVVVFDAGGDRRVIEANDLADFDYSGMQFGEGPRMTGFKGEQRFTSALLELQEGAKSKVLITTGHGEADLDAPGPEGFASARDLLARDNFEVQEWASLGETAVPADADLVIIAGPTSGFVAPELEVFGAYLARGGRILVLLDPTVAQDAAALVDTGLAGWLAGYGVTVGDDIVVDPSNPLPFFGAETIFANVWQDHPISRSLRQANLPAVFALARSVRAAPGEPKSDLASVELVTTSPEGWGERDLANLREVKKDATDLAGPVPLAVVVAGRDAAAASEPDPDGEAGGGAAEPPAAAAAAPATGAGMRLAVYGDSDFARNAQLANAGNPTLLTDTINWLVEREQALGIAAKTPEQVRLNLTGGQLSGIFWLVVGLLPLIAMSLGVAVFLRRRR